VNRNQWLGTITAACFVAVLMLASNVLRYGWASLFLPGSWLSALEAGLFVAVLWCAIRTVRDLLRLPALPPKFCGKFDALLPEEKEKLVQWILEKAEIDDATRSTFKTALNAGMGLTEPLEQWRERSRSESREIIRRYAVRVGLATALSQNGALDSVAVLYLSFEMLRELYAVWGLRPSQLSLVRTFVVLLRNTLLAGAAEEMLPKDVFVGVSGRFMGLFWRSFIDGAMNAWLLLRFGLFAEHLILNGEVPTREVRLAIRREACSMIPGISKTFWEEAVRGLRFLRILGKKNEATDAESGLEPDNIPKKAQTPQPPESPLVSPYSMDA